MKRLRSKEFWNFTSGPLDGVSLRVKKGDVTPWQITVDGVVYERGIPGGAESGSPWREPTVYHPFYVR